MSIVSKAVSPDINDKGEYALWDKGKLIGHGRMEMFNGRMVLASKLPVLKAMFDAALKDGITLILNQGHRSFGQQMELRKKHLKDKSKINDEAFLLNAPSSEFSPPTGKPGWSNHHDGSAYDIKTRDDAGKYLPAYSWLIKRAIEFGFIRTVPSETWHWEHRPGYAQYSVVPQNHPSWKV